MTVAVEKPRLALKHILFTTDFSDSSRHALPFATSLARHYGAELLLTHVVEQIPMSSVPMDAMPADLDRAREHGEHRMSEFLRHPELEGLKTKTIVETGFLWPIVADLVHERHIDLIVLGTHGRGAMKRLLLGSAAEEIFRHAACPVLTIGPHVEVSRARKEQLETILFATDFSTGSAHALDYALKLTHEHDSQLLMIHVVHSSAIPFDITDDFVAESEAKLKDMVPPGDMPKKPPLFLTLLGVPSEQVLSFAERETVDLIVMGMHKGTELSSHWPNEFAAKVIAGARCPVLSVRGEGPSAREIADSKKPKHHRTIDETSLP